MEYVIIGIIFFIGLYLVSKYLPEIIALSLIVLFFFLVSDSHFGGGNYGDNSFSMQAEKSVTKGTGKGTVTVEPLGGL